MSAQKKLRKDSEIQFVGHECDIIPSVKLPTVRQVFSFLVYQVRPHNMSLRGAAWKTAKAVTAIWQNTKIPLQQEVKQVGKLEKLYNEWRTLCKHSERRNAVEKFVSGLDKLFDISKRNAIDIMECCGKKAKSQDVLRTYLQDIQFLRDQRDGPRVYVMGGLDLKMKAREMEAARRAERSKANKLKSHQEDNILSLDEAMEIDAALSSEAEGDSEYRSPSSSSSSSSRPASRGRRNVITPEVVQAIDAAKLSCYGAAEVLSAATVALGGKVKDTNINPSTIYRKREKLRAEKVGNMKEKKHMEVDTVLTVHWDGKKVEALDSVGPSKRPDQERQAVIVTGATTDLVLGSPVLPSGNAEAICSAVHGLLLEWKVADKVRAACFDTTAVNTGWLHGAAVKLEAALGRELLWLPCRHHVFERVLESAYRAVMGPSSGPEDKIFTDLEKAWPSLDLAKYSTFQTLAVTRRHLAECADDMIIFAKSRIQEGQPRADYRELLNLVIIFLGGQPDGGVSFGHPGPVSSARWMSVALYCLRLHMFRNQVKLPKKQADGVTQVVIFIVRVYTRTWFRAPLAVCAPRNDLHTLKTILDFKSVNKTIAEAAVTRMVHHSWYLSEVMMGITIFDEGLPDAEKEKIVKNMRAKEGEEDAPRKRSCIQLHDVPNMDVSDLVTTNSLHFFDTLNLKTEFLTHPVTEWPSHEDYKNGLKIVKNLRVVNDTAERGVKLFKDFNKILTRKESSNQDLVVSVAEHRTLRPNFKKSTLTAIYDK